MKSFKKYNLKEKVDDKGWIYVRIEQGMYGLPQAGRLANKLLAKRLDQEGYYQCQYTPGLWRHKWRPITFCLVVDDFGIKTIGLSHAKHLKTALEKYYEVTVDWKEELFCGITHTGTIKNKPSISLCHNTFQKHSNVFNTHLLHDPNMLRTNASPPNMAK